MIWTIVRKELAELARDGRHRWIGGGLAVLSALALVSGLAEASRAQRERALAEEADRQEWLAQGERNPHSAAHFGQFAFKPVGPLAFFDHGYTPYLGHAIWLEAHWQDPAELRPAEDAGTGLRLADLSGAALLQTLGPLLVILLGFGTLAGERERGTLRQLLAQGVAPWRLLAGKGLGMAATLGAVLAPVALLAAGIALFSVPTGSRGDLVLRGAWLAVAYLLYLAFWIAATLMVSSRASTERAALALLLGLWALSTFLVPRWAADQAESRHPSPTRTGFYSQIDQDLEQGIDGHGPADERGKKLEQEVLARYGAATLDELPVSFAGIALQAGEEYGNQVFDRRFGELWSTYDRQLGTVRALGLLSPLLWLRQASMVLAGTDLAAHRGFAQAAEAHRRVLNARLNQDMTEHGKGADYGYLATSALWAEIPFHRPATEAATAVLRRARIDLALLGAAVLLAVLGTGLAARRLSPL